MLRPVNEQLVSELARSIQNIGILQPIAVRERRGKYQVVFGNHRVEACLRLGLKSIAAFVVNFTDSETFLARVTENLLRNVAINPLEEAQGYKMLVGSGWSINAIAGKIGKCDSYVCERLALLSKLTLSVQNKLVSGKSRLTASHAELISRIRSAEMQDEVADLVEKRRLSVRVLEDMLRDNPEPKHVSLGKNALGVCLQIPEEFVEAMEVLPGQVLLMYLSGGKLILEDINRSRKKRSHVRSRLPRTTRGG
jgi:ParB family chromosome partitioning protein